MTTSLALTVRRRLAGLLGIVVLGTSVFVTLGIYQKLFVSATMVTVDAPRAGLLMDKGADVRINDLKVGEVRSVQRRPDGGVALRVALDNSAVRLIPRDVTADITPTTVFGAKYVELHTSGARVSDPIAAGDVINVDYVTVEANDEFRELQDFLTAVQPAKLNAALTAVSTALSGRGKELGTYLTDVDHYLAAINLSQPAIRADIATAQPVLDEYADAAPGLIATARHLTVTSGTLTKDAAALQSFLVDWTQASGAAQGLVQNISDPLTGALGLLRPVTEMLAKYSPAFPCTIEGLAKHVVSIERVLGAQLPGIQGLVSLLPSQQGYQYPRDLPKLVPDTGPDCLSLPAMNLAHPPHRRFDDGQHVYDGKNQLTVGQPPAKVYLDLIQQWFGKSGLNLLIQQLSGQSAGGAAGGAAR